MSVQELLVGRRTYRRFDETKEIPTNVIADIKEALRLSSCGMNKQGLQYIFVRSQSKIAEIFDYTHWAAALPNGAGQPKVGERPTLLVFITYNEKNKPPFVDIDAGIAMANSTLAAWEHGVGSCVLKNLNYKELSEAIGLGEGDVLHSLVAFGYPTCKSTIVSVKDGKINYYLDDNKDYCVPKYTVEDITRDI